MSSEPGNSTACHNVAPRCWDDSVQTAATRISRSTPVLAKSFVRLHENFLTREHFEGRRVHWVSPVRLYLIFSVCYFAIIPFTGESPLEVNLRFTGNTGEENTQALQQLGFASEEEVVYGGSTARAAAHTIVVLTFYKLATILVAAAIIAPVLFWN